MKNSVPKVCLFLAVTIFFACSVKAQTTVKTPPAAAPSPQIPEEFWDFPIDYFSFGAEVSVNLVAKADPTPRMLFRQMKFYSKKQLDGTEQKSELVKTTLKGNSVIFTVRTTSGPGQEFMVDLAVACDMQEKSNHIAYWRFYSSSADESLYFKPPRTEYEVMEFKIFYKQILNFFSIWYGQDELIKSLFK